ncbi:MAG: CHAT domain-containing protein [Chitinophagales bacterium]
MLYLNWGISFLQQRNTEKALFYLQKSLEEAVKTYGHQHLTIGRIYDSIGSCYTFMNDFEKAENYFEKAFDIFQNNENSQIRDFASVWTYLGYLFHQKQQYLKAIQFHQKALKHILSNQVSEDIYSHPFLETQVYPRQISVRYHFLIRILCNKAHSFRAYYLYKTQKNRDLEAANDAYKAVVYFGDGIRQAFLADVSKLIVAKEVQKALVKAVGVAVMRFEWAQKTEHFQYAFELSEKGKAYLLLINAQEKNIQQTSDIPQNLAQKENELENKLILLEKSIQNQEQKGENANQELLQQWKIDSFNTYTQFETLKKQLETDYPNYYQQKYNTEIVFITNLQSSLQDNQTVLSYFIGEEKIYLFAITPDEYEVFTLEKPDNWTNLVQNYLQSIKLHQKTEFHRYSFELYQTLLQEAMHHIIDPFEEEVKQVFIIPHAELHYLPFETLLIAEADTSISYNELDYLLNHCQISYHYSATLLHLDLQKQASSAEQAPTEMTFTGFAPVYESSSEGQKQALQSLQSDYATAVNRSEAVRGDGTWMPLPYSKIEVENIAQLFEQQGLKNQFFLNERANKRNLEKQIGKSRFVLIAAHGIVNNEYPELSGLVLAENTMDDRWRTTNGVENSPSFEKHGDIWNGEEERNVEEMAVEDCILNMKEVAMIPMDADLVVLSSCESGIGELHKGEGMMAVNRGFLASGAKNVVSTLFKVNDRASSELTQLLFANILKGENYSIALQKAKLELLKKRKDVSPKMWSGFVLFGTGL